MSKLELSIMQDVIRRIKKTGEITSTADRQLNVIRSMGYSTYEIESYIKKKLNLTYQEVFELYDKASIKDYIRDETLYTVINENQTPIKENIAISKTIKAIKKRTKNEFVNISKSCGFKIGNKFLGLRKFFNKTIDEAIIEMASGAFSPTQTMRKAIHIMTNSGVRCIPYESGLTYRIDTAVRSCVMNGYNSLVKEINFDNAEQLGTNYFEVTAHGGARPEHAEWQGGVYTKDELYTICEMDSPTGLYGINCSHDAMPFIPELSTRAYSDEQLEEWRNPLSYEYNGKTYTPYEAIQRQRTLERRMKVQREKITLFEQAGDFEQQQRYQRQYKNYRKEYKKFSKKTKQKEHFERVYLDAKGKVL